VTAASTGPIAAARRHPALLLMAAMTFWVIVEIIASPAMRAIPVMELVWLRYVFHLLFMVVVLAPRVGLGFVRTGRPGLQIVRALLMVVMPGSFVLASRVMPGEPLMGIFWIAPIVVLIGASAIGERASPVTWAAVVAGWVVALLLYRPGAWALHWTAIYPAAMGASFALYIVLTRVLDRTDGGLTNLFYSAAGVLLALTPAVPFFWQTPSKRALAIAAVVGVLGFAVLWLLDLALRVWSAPRVAVFLFFQIVAATLVDAVANQRFTGTSLWVGTLVLALAMYVETRRKPAPQETEWSNAHA
jgi:drug/metabolite transporter (DMT)-like permease